MAKGNFRTNDTVCLFCGHTEMKDDKKVKMPYKVGKGANKIYLCEKCYNKNYKEESK